MNEIVDDGLAYKYRHPAAAWHDERQSVEWRPGRDSSVFSQSNNFVNIINERPSIKLSGGAPSRAR